MSSINVFPEINVSQNLQSYHLTKFSKLKQLPVSSKINTTSDTTSDTAFDTAFDTASDITSDIKRNIYASASTKFTK